MTQRPVSLLIKTVGPDCNLRCDYCFYRGKSCLFPDAKVHRFSDETLEEMIRQAMTSEAIIPMFSWQGGEPALAGLDFFKKAVEFQKKYGRPGQVVSNALQTNGLLLDEEWAEFLAEYNFLVGLSIDGPGHIHNYYRKDASGNPTYERVVKVLEILQQAGVETNILAVVNNKSVKEPELIYRSLLDLGISFLQFVPCIELLDDGRPTEFSVIPKDMGKFLVKIAELWSADFPNVSVRDLDALVMHRLGRPCGMCVYEETCGSYMVVEHNGNVYPCDFFVEPEWKLGNIHEQHLADMAASKKFQEFALRKTQLPSKCRDCEWLDNCHGGCPKHRTVLNRPIDSPSSLCPAYQRLFREGHVYLELAAQALIGRGFPGPYG